MKKFIFAFAAVFVAFPVMAMNYKISSVTSITLNQAGHSQPTSATIGSSGNILRLGCDIDCWVALSTTDGQGTHGFVDGVTAETGYIYLPAKETAYVKSPGARYIVGGGASGGTLYITEMSP